MDSPDSTKVLSPSYPRAFVRIFGMLLVGGVLGAISDRYRLGTWWTWGYIVSLLFPVLLVPALICAMSVPRRLEWSEKEFRIRLLGRKEKVIPWTLLYAYGSSYNVFLLQFEGLSTFQIFAGAFASKEWKAFQTFLITAHPDKKARFWLGPKAIRKS